MARSRNTEDVVTTSPMIWGCLECGWKYEPSLIMGIHRVPVSCPICDARRIRGMRQEAWDVHEETEDTESPAGA